MKISITFVLFAFVAQTFSLTCPTFTCTKAFENKLTCATKTIVDNVFSVIIKPCDDDKFACPFTERLDEDDICTDVPVKMYPGEVCNTGNDCINGTCKDGKCKSGEVGNDCKTHMDCGEALYCLNKKCANLVDANGACSDTVLCKVGLACANGNCTKIASIENEKPAFVPATCKSYYMENGACTDGPILNEADKKSETCPRPEGCQYTFKGKPDKKVTEPCVCGMTPNSTGICRPGEGDTKLDDVRGNVHFIAHYLFRQN